MRHTRSATAAVVAVLLFATACSGGGADTPSSAPPADQGETSADPSVAPAEDPTTEEAAPPETGYATDGTFTIAITGDPGTLNPLNNASTFGNWLNRFIYDPLVSRGPDGQIVSGLADEWSFEDAKATFHINPAATCSDGSPVTPSVIAKNFEYMLNPENPATNIGSVLPNRNYTFEADDATGTFTLNLETPFSLLPSALSFLFIVCGPAADDPQSLTTTSSGSGPYVLTEAVASSQYVMTRRDGYTWGADGATTDQPGTPATVVLKVVENETTSANLLLSGEVNAAVVNGQDRARLEASGLANTTFVSGGVVQSYNQSEGRITADKAVRLALAQATDRGGAATAMTQGLLPEPGTSLAAATPQACDDSAAATAIPAYDAAAAAAGLEAAGWVAGSDGIRAKDGQRLSLTAIYSTAWPGGAAAAELIAGQWSEIGVEAVLTPLGHPDYIQKIQQTGDYDVVIVQQFSNPFPSTLIGMLAGPPPPDGMNAAHFDNPAYKTAVEQARVTMENSGCEFWTEASRAVFENVDMIPIAQWPTNWVFAGGEMDALGGRPIATSLRVLAG